MTPYARTMSQEGALAYQKPPLWRCPKCGQRFTTRNMWHSCGRFGLDDLFVGSDPHVRQLYELFVEIVRTFGPVTVIPQKSRIAFQVRMRFAALMPQRRALKGHLILADRQQSPCFEKIETYSPRCHLHQFRLETASQLNDEFRGWIGKAYKVGCQEPDP